MQSLRYHRRTALLLGFALLGGVSSILPLAGLFGRPDGWLQFRPAIRPIPGGDLGLPWLMGVAGPSAAQQEAVSTLGTLLLYTLAGTILVAMVTVLSVAAARWAERRTEYHIRRAVGASRRTLFAAALAELIVLAAIPVLVGSMIGLSAARLVEISWPGTVAPGTNALAAAAVIVVLGVCAGMLLVPAMIHPRPVKEGPMHQPLPTFPAGFQIAVCLVVLTMGGILTGRAKQLGSTTPVGTGNGTVATISLDSDKPQERSARFRRLLDSLERAGMHSVSLSSPGTLSGLGHVAMVLTDCGRCTEAGMLLSFRLKPATHKVVSADTFRLVGVPVVAGRGITPEDHWDSPRVAVVSRSLAAREFQDGNPIGRRIHTGDDGAEGSTVVGIVENQLPIALGGTLQPRHGVYVSVLQHPPQTVDLLIRDPADEQALKRILETDIGSAGHYALHSERTMRTAEVAPVRWFGQRFELQGWALVGLASLGIIGYMGLWVRSLTDEIAVRRSVGARRNQILRWVLWRAMVIALEGIVMGLWFGIAVWGTLPEVVTGTAAQDPSYFVPYAVLIVGVVLCGVLVPAWRASRARPADLLQSPGS
jgi:putative ABC transport system permease protein